MDARRWTWVFGDYTSQELNASCAHKQNCAVDQNLIQL